ncbi:MAG: tetratricopeptide repeat protein [Turneriella sp.]
MKTGVMQILHMGIPHLRSLAFLLAAGVMILSAAEYPAQYYFDQAANLAKAGDTLKASDMAREALRKDGNHVPALLLLGRITAESSQLKLAQELVKRALKLDAQNEAAFILCARVEYQLKNPLGMEECLTGAEKIRRNNPDAQSLRVQVLIDNAQYGIARRKIDGILRDFPGHTETHLRLAGLYLKLKQFERAEAQFRKIQALLPDNSDVAVAIARARLSAFFESTRYTDFDASNDAAVRALDALKHAYSNNQESMSVRLMLAQLLSVTGHCNDAMEHWKKLSESQAEARSVVVFYAMCDPASPESAKALSNYLRRNEDDDLTRHQSELLTIVQNVKRENAAAGKAARYHRNLARREAERNADEFALSELRWAEYLFPAYIEAHRDLLRHFRTRKDYERLADELIFLRDRTGDKSYREMVEQLEVERRDLWYLKEGVRTPERMKNPVPLHIYPFKPKDPLIDHPQGGIAIADRARVTLQDFGRMRSISREMAALAEAQKYSPANLRKLRQTYSDALRAEENQFPFLRRSLGMVMVGDFSELAHGVEVNAELVDAESGIRVAQIRFKALGKDYLNKTAVRLAEFAYNNTQISANVLRVLDDERILINAGRRDGIAKQSQFSVLDKLGRVITFKAEKRDFDIIEARGTIADATRHIKAGDVVRLVPKT